MVQPLKRLRIDLIIGLMFMLTKMKTANFDYL